jgi:hypothetical protein
LSKKLKACYGSSSWKHLEKTPEQNQTSISLSKDLDILEHFLFLLVPYSLTGLIDKTKAKYHKDAATENFTLRYEPNLLILYSSMISPLLLVKEPISCQKS